MMDSAWQLAGCSVVGASHLRAGLGHHVALSVADGHGSPRSFRSAAGARFANEVALDLAEELMDASLSPDQLRFIKDRLEQDAPRRLVREWRARVQRDVAAHPFSSNETDR